MRRFLAVTALIALLAGCSSDGSNANEDAAPSTTSTASTTTTIAPTTTLPPTPEEAYLAEARERIPDYVDQECPDDCTGMWRERFIASAYEVCDDAINGDTEWGSALRPVDHSPAVMLAHYYNVIDPMSETGIRARLAVAHLCPEAQPVLDELDAGNVPPNPMMSEYRGVNTVGTDIQPGNYIAYDVDGCYWEKLDASGQTIDNDFITAAPQVIVTVEPSVFAVNFEGCVFFPQE